MRKLSLTVVRLLAREWRRLGLLVTQVSFPPHSLPEGRRCLIPSLGPYPNRPKATMGQSVSIAAGGGKDRHEEEL